MVMATIKYETKDVMPIVLLVLNFMGSNLNSATFKLAFDHQYADLKGLVDPEELDQPTTDLIELLDDPLSLLLKAFAERFIRLYDMLAVMHGINLAEVFSDKRLADMAEEIFCLRSYYSYGLSDDNRTDLDIFVYSLPNVILQLKDIVVTQEFDPEEQRNWVDVDPDCFDEFEQSELPMVRILGDMAFTIYAYQDKIVFTPH